MKKNLISLGAGLALLGMCGMANAALLTIGTANYNGSDYNLIWDDDNNGNSVVWLDYSNARTRWEYQVAWAAGLGSELTYNIDARYNVSWDSDWRLGSAVDGLFQFGYDGTTTGGYNITNSEMGHLFYEELGNLARYDTSGNEQSGYGLRNTGIFNNLIEYAYWSGTEYTARPDGAWDFIMGLGYQNVTGKGAAQYALALRSGQVSTVPEPSTMLLFSVSLLGLAAYGRKKIRHG